MDAGRTRNRSQEYRSCTRCNGTFKRPEHLRRHERIHDMNKRYGCSQCPKTFTRSDILRRHEATHTATSQTDGPGTRRKRACTECARARERCTKSDPCQRCSTKGLSCSYPQDPAIHSPPAAVSQNSIHRANIGVGASSTISEQSATPFVDTASTNTHSAFTMYNNEQAAPFDMMSLAGNDNQDIHSTMDFPLNWLPSDNSIAIDYDNILGLGINSLGLFSSLSASIPDPPALMPATPDANAIPMVGTAQTGAFTQRNLLSRPTDQQSLSWNAESPEIMEGQISSPSSTSAIHIIPPDAAPGGLYATSSNGARMPCTIRSRRPIRLIPGTTPIISVLDTRFRPKDILDQLEFPDTTRISADQASPLIGSRMPSIPALSVTTYENIEKHFKSLCLTEGNVFSTYTAARFPSFSSFDVFVDLYYENFDAVVPILHDQVTSMDDHWLLALAVCTIGCQYAEAEEFSACVIPLQELLHRGTTVELARRDLEDIGQDKQSIALAQAVTLSHISMLYFGSTRLLRLATAQRSTLIELARFCSASSPPRRTDNGWINDPEARELAWKTALLDECKRRIGYTIWLLDSMAVYHFAQQPVMSHDIVELPLPSDKVWVTKSSADWIIQPEATTKMPSLSAAVVLIFREKHIKPDLGQFSRVLLLHGVYREIFQLSDRFARPLSDWIPSMQQAHKENSSPESLPISNPDRQTLLSSWRNAALDCVDVLHWAANATIALQAGAEHPTVLHLHLARTVLLAPFDQIQTLATSIASVVRDSPFRRFQIPNGQQAIDAERDVLEWAQKNQYKARLAVLHCGCLFWHIRRYSCRAFYEPASVFLATLTIWAYSSYASRAGLPNRRTRSNRNDESRQEDSSTSPRGSNAASPISDTEPIPTFIHLDRPNDDEMVQFFVRFGTPSEMKAYITGVGDINSPTGPRRILREGRKILGAVSMAWGRTQKYASMLHALEQVASEHVNGNAISFSTQSGTI